MRSSGLGETLRRHNLDYPADIFRHVRTLHSNAGMRMYIAKAENGTKTPDQRTHATTRRSPHLLLQSYSTSTEMAAFITQPSPANFYFPILLDDRTTDSAPLNKHRFLLQCWYDYTASESPSISDVAEVVVEEVRRNAEYLKIRSDSAMDVRMYEARQVSLWSGMTFTFLQLQDKSLRPATSTHDAWERACQNVDDAYLRANATCYTPRIKLANVKKLQDLAVVLYAFSRSFYPCH